jgi:hypothetical protein
MRGPALAITALALLLMSVPLSGPPPVRRDPAMFGWLKRPKAFKPYLSRYIDDPSRWRQWMSREHPGLKPTTPLEEVYLRDSREAVRDWSEARSRGFKGKEAFLAALSRMHKQSANYYRLKEKVPGRNYDFEPMPGQIRSRIKDRFKGMLEEVNLYSFETRDQPTSLALQLREAAFRRHEWPATGYSRQPSVTLDLEFQGRTYTRSVDLVGSGFSIDGSWTTRLAGFTDAESPQLPPGKFAYQPAKELQNPMARVYTPNGERLELFLEKGYARWTELETALRDAPQAEETLRKLSDYYQTMISAHPFRYVNNSILMSQVNEVLASIGRAPVLHGGMDFWAFTLDSTEFRRFFVDYIHDPRNQIAP